MNGKRFIILFISSVVIFTAALFYFQNYAYYDPIDIRQNILLGKKRYEISYYQGIDSESSGLKLRECFVVDTLENINLPIYEKPTPLIAPFWFKCFNAERITKDLEDGKASAFLFQKEEFDGIDNVIAIYPDGRSYRWRQLNSKYMKE
jgi:ABC-type sugar transport system ATPase subunit